VDPLFLRRRSADRAAVARLRDAGSVLDAAEALVAEAGSRGVELPLLAARLTVPLARLAADLPAGTTLATLGQDPPVVVSREALARLGESALAAVEAFHRGQPLKTGMPREELRTRTFAQAPVPVFERVLQDLAAAGRVRLLPDVVAAARHEVRLSSGEEEVRVRLVDAAQTTGLANVELPTLAERSKKNVKVLDRVARVLVTKRVLNRIKTTLLVHRDHLESLKVRVRERWPKKGKIEIKTFKEMTGLSRKYVIPLLEYLDRERVTRRAGNDRIVL
jgi:selenocysteine-specific elongation factor